ncbi:hypothetical protein ABG79_01539 [Caloramator mitchellensis]|uniref:YesK-like protein n=1 Tax=Caloramator mitchellensis TaxID=908809 RepID=A0A0R3JZZ3_CALMK|nr:hypothetical protein [Caloramator mitchellensis]KRQ86556.1 hypothetical protein ABG79_01539 [Caloramator mitchellensis]
MGRFLTLIVATSLISAILTYMFFRLFKRIRLVKYIPGLIFILISILSFYKGKTATEGFLDIANFLFSLIFAVAAITNFLFSLFLDHKYKV